MNNQKSNHKILIVDDIQDVREVICTSIQGAYPIIYEAGSGNEAIDILKKEHFDLILLDFAMPHGNGLDVLKNISNFKNSKIKAIVFSDYCSILPDDPEFDSVTAIIEKPYSPAKLLAVINEALK